MNPFKGKNLSNIKISSTNIRGMTIGTDREEKKLGTILDLNSDIIFLIDHHLDQAKLASLIKNNRNTLAIFNYWHTYTKKRNLSLY